MWYKYVLSGSVVVFSLVFFGCKTNEGAPPSKNAYIRSLISSFRDPPPPGSDDLTTTESKILACGKDAIPALINSLDDKTKSSVGSRFGVMYENSFMTIGEVCHDLLSRLITLQWDVIDIRLTASGTRVTVPHYFSEIGFKYKDLAKRKMGLLEWWKKNKHLSIWEIREEALKWKLAKEESIDFADSSEKTKVLQSIKKKLKDLEKKKAEVPGA